MNTPRPLNPTGPSLNPPACPVLAVSRIIIYLYLNTHKAYTGEGTTTQEKQGYTQSRERSKAVKEQRKKKRRKNKSKLHHTEALEVIMVKERH